MVPSEDVDDAYVPPPAPRPVPGPSMAASVDVPAVWPPRVAPRRFSRTWAVSWKRWARAWVSFAGLSLVLGLMVIALAPAPDATVNSEARILGTYMGFAVGYLLVWGWWFDHVLARGGARTSVFIQMGVAAVLGYSTASDDYRTVTTYWESPPPLVLAALGSLAVLMAHSITRDIRGSFPP